MSRRVGYAEAAKYIGVNPATLRTLVYRKQIPHIRLSVRLVVFDLDVLDAWLESKLVKEEKR